MVMNVSVVAATGNAVTNDWGKTRHPRHGSQHQEHPDTQRRQQCRSRTRKRTLISDHVPVCALPTW